MKSASQMKLNPSFCPTESDFIPAGDFIHRRWIYSVRRTDLVEKGKPLSFDKGFPFSESSVVNRYGFDKRKKSTKRLRINVSEQLSRFEAAFFIEKSAVFDTLFGFASVINRYRRFECRWQIDTKQRYVGGK